MGAFARCQRAGILKITVKIQLVGIANQLNFLTKQRAVLWGLPRWYQGKTLDTILSPKKGGFR